MQRNRLQQPAIRMGLASAAVALGLMLGTAARPALAGGTIKGQVTSTPAKYLAETVVYLEEVPGEYEPKSVEMDQKGLTFVPHIVTITVGDTVKFLNHDHVSHNVFSPEAEFDLGKFGEGITKEHKFEKTGTSTLLCSLHPEMLAYVFVGQNPYAAVVDEKGNYEIKDVPAGTWKLAVWNSHLKAASTSVEVTDEGTATADLHVKR